MSQQDVLKVLQLFNVSEKEASFYLASLRVKNGTAYEIAKKANIKRPTAYSLIESLVAKGLMTTYAQRSKMMCQPVSPRRLVAIWKGRVQALEAISPELNAVYQNDVSNPHIQIFEGERGIDAVYSELMPPDTKGQEILAFGSVATMQEKFNYRLTVWSRMVKNKKNYIKELVDCNEGAVEYVQKMQSLGNPHYQPRIMKVPRLGMNDNMIFKNKLAIFSIKDELFSVIIESQEIIKTYTALFETAWNAAEEHEW